ncbi:uncharacterized protein LOC119256736 isoform X2 [Talpa occidentalis]|uniref:uncharacterized protein LOC119256736 isoform X2 n=1 Tax=Talpa occidentalis TaxID=50954 RepID=UPI0023F89A06|nr:uncharacterized protein LOC119256736 isoform X2 [Talpa occidentalis]
MIKKAFGVSCLEINFLQAELEEVQEFYFQDSETGAGKPEQESVIKSTTIARNPVLVRGERVCDGRRLARLVSLMVSSKMNEIHKMFKGKLI